ncbi:MAG: hypothetical protein JW388_1308 [Nitrospira sp.]|nr:hypothetical protein [Nitrospira sp.]
MCESAESVLIVQQLILEQAGKVVVGIGQVTQCGATKPLRGAHGISGYAFALVKEAPDGVLGCRVGLFCRQLKPSMGAAIFADFVQFPPAIFVFVQFLELIGRQWLSAPSLRSEFKIEVTQFQLRLGQTLVRRTGEPLLGLCPICRCVGLAQHQSGEIILSQWMALIGGLAVESHRFNRIFRNTQSSFVHQREIGLRIGETAFGSQSIPSGRIHQPASFFISQTHIVQGDDLAGESIFPEFGFDAIGTVIARNGNEGRSDSDPSENHGPLPSQSELSPVQVHSTFPLHHSKW